MIGPDRLARPASSTSWTTWSRRSLFPRWSSRMLTPVDNSEERPAKGNGPTRRTTSGDRHQSSQEQISLKREP